MRERAPLQLRFVGIEVRVLRPVRVCLDAVASRLGVERQSGKVCSQKNVSPSALKLLARKGLQSLLQRRLYASCDQYRRLRASSRELGRNAARRVESNKTWHDSRPREAPCNGGGEASYNSQGQPRIVLLEVAASGRVEPRRVKLRVSTRPIFAIGHAHRVESLVRVAPGGCQLPVTFTRGSALSEGCA